MTQYIDKAALAVELEKRIAEGEKVAKELPSSAIMGLIQAYKNTLSFLDTLEVKEANLNNGIQLTWEDIRELYIIFAEVDVDIELCKTADIQAETIGYYQEVLKRFKSQKGE